MAGINFRVQNAVSNGFRTMDEVDATAATVGGWKVGKTSAGNSANLTVGTEQATFSSQTTTPKPTGLVTGAAGDAWVSANPYNGDFDTSAWTIKIATRSVSTAMSGTGRVRVRVFASANADGSSARELTGSTQVGTTAGPGSTSADIISTVTWTPASAIHLSNEYIFIAMAWEIITASGSNNADNDIRTGSSGTTTGSNVLTGNFTASVSKSGSDSGSSSESASVALPKVTGTARLALSTVGTPPAGTVTLHVRAKMGGSDSGVLEVSLYQGATLIEGPYDISLTSSFATDDHVVSNAGSITDWSQLEVRLQGISSSSHDTLSPQVSWVALESPLGSTPISGTDSGTTSAAQTLTAQESSSDNGTSTEVIHPFIRTLPADLGVISDVAKIAENTTDTPSDTESATISVPVAGTDAGSDTESILKISISGITDSGSETEAQSEVAQIPGADSGSDSENGKISFSGIDSGSDTEAQSEIAQATVTDAGSDTEIGKINEITIETGSDSEASQLTASVTSQDQNSSTAENASTGTPVSATDTASDSETTQQAVRTSTPDSGSDSEITKIGLSGTDSNLDNEVLALTTQIPGLDSATAIDSGSTNTQNSFTSSETPGASETAQEGVSLSSGPEGASGADTASVRVFLNPALDAGSGIEQAIFTVQMILADAGISTDQALPQVSWLSVDSASGAEQQIQTISPLDSESGIGSDGYTISAQLLDAEAGQLSDIGDKIDLAAAAQGFERNLIAAGIEQGVLIATSESNPEILSSEPQRGQLLRAR